MRSKLSWITFIPLCLIAVFCKLAQFIFPDGIVPGLSNLMMDYLLLGSVVLIFLFTLLFCLIDRKISAYYLPHRNIVAGIFGLLLALTLAADGANEIFHIISSGKIEALRLIEAVLLLLSAVVFVILGLTHSFRADGSKGFVLFNVMPALLCAVRMVECFVQFTTISIRLADVPCLLCYVFATLFFFNYAVALSLIKAKNAVKSCFIFGFPTVAALFAYAVPKLIFSFDTQDLLSNFDIVEIALMGLYVLAFMIELTAFAPSRDRVTVIEDDKDALPEGVEVAPDMNADDIVLKSEADDTADDSAYLTNTDTEHFLYTEVKPVDDNPPVNEDTVNDTDGYLTQATEDADEVNSEKTPVDYDKRMDEIDKLILEISSQSD